MALLLLLAAAQGCGWNHTSQTIISVRFSGEDLLHVALVPRTLPDGTPATKQREALVAELTGLTGAVAFLSSVQAATVAAAGEEPVRSDADMLMVEGAPEVAFALRRRLREDFQQERPWVVSVPTQAVALVRIPEEETEPAPEPEQPKP